MGEMKDLKKFKEEMAKRGFLPAFAQAVLEIAQAVDAVEVVRCKDCVHAVEIEKDYVRKLFVDGTKQCELGRGDAVFGYSIVSNDGFCDSGERKYNG